MLGGRRGGWTKSDQGGYSLIDPINVCCVKGNPLLPGMIALLHTHLYVIMFISERHHEKSLYAYLRFVSTLSGDYYLKLHALRVVLHYYRVPLIQVLVSLNNAALTLWTGHIYGTRYLCVTLKNKHFKEVFLASISHDILLTGFRYSTTRNKCQLILMISLQKKKLMYTKICIYQHEFCSSSIQLKICW